MRSYNVAARMVVRLAVVTGMVWGCGGKGKEKAKEKSAEVRSEVKESVPDLDKAERCMEGLMRDPKEAFHLSTVRKDDTAAPFTSEAEFTPETVEGTTNWGTGQKAQQVSSVHSDVNAWGLAVNSLTMRVSTVTGDFRIAQPTVVAAGADAVNGYDTVKYDFDTERLPEAEKARIAVTLLAKDFNVAGSAWITKDTKCMVKFVSDDKSTSKSGMAGATHLEGSISRR
jgi:murein L,D-transpeptidase YcbB/YkuD